MSDSNPLDLIATGRIKFVAENDDKTAPPNETSQPMYFCETCQQPLCFDCKQSTHRAKMFARHKIVQHEERSRAIGQGTCAEHGEPYILFSTDSKRLVCIACFRNAPLESRHHFVQLDLAHKMGCEKLNKVTNKLKAFQGDVKEQILSRKKLLQELDESESELSEQIRQTCQQMVDRLLQVRDDMLNNLTNERNERECHFKSRMQELCNLLPPIQLYLLGATVICASATKLDFLDMAYDLMRKMQQLIGDSQDNLKPMFTGRLEVNCRDEFARALEPYLGFSSLLLPPDDSSSTNDSSGSHRRPSRRGTSAGCGGSAGYVNCPGGGGLISISKYQLMVDLTGAFGDEFAKLETPLRDYAALALRLSRDTQEIQKDMTRRKCAIASERVDDVYVRATELDRKLASHSLLIKELQPTLQHIWQEQLDRVRRQQLIFKDKVETSMSLRRDLKQIGRAAEQLRSYATTISDALLTIDPRRLLPPDEAPMERICSQIQHLAVDSQMRVDAIEKEEQNRRSRSEQQKLDETTLILEAKRALKPKKEQTHRKAAPLPPPCIDSGGNPLNVVKTVDRDRNHPTMVSPGKRKPQKNPDRHSISNGHQTSTHSLLTDADSDTTTRDQNGGGAMAEVIENGFQHAVKEVENENEELLATDTSPSTREGRDDLSMTMTTLYHENCSNGVESLPVGGETSSKSPLSSFRCPPNGE